jgi:hypothetical protein
MDEISDVASATITPYTARALKREALIAKATEQLPSVAQTGDVETATQFADVMGDISKRNISGKVAGFANLGPETAKILQSGVEDVAQVSRGLRSRGMQTSVPADIASLRKFIMMGKGKYEAPYAQPTETTPDFFDGPDMDTKGSAMEVGAAQRRNQYKGSIKESILQQKISLLEERIKKKPQHLPFEILGIDAPLDYGKKNFDPSMIGIYGRHVRPDGSRGPEVNIPVHAFADMHHNDVIDHAEDYMRGKGRRSPDNPLFKALNDQDGDSPSTFKVDTSKVESIESYNKRVEEEGL